MAVREMDRALGIDTELDSRTLQVATLSQGVLRAVVAARCAIRGYERGPTNTWDEVRTALCDTAVHTLVALHGIAGDPARVFAERLEVLALQVEPSVSDVPPRSSPHQTVPSTSR
ncbi:hypothetical protein [Streptomyces zhihengii]|uniref:hypothetical protein n=1 Tax=Streptomyces zhihengii TaxID=1818004 RepID=UPI0033B8122D